ncbi:MAG: RluA family pseudouridine synthase [Treponemataceae bacterium]|nr:RluA family pseudouridine synthase [Treponemataceae bacterium]
MNKLQILFENDEIRVINKPQGLAVQGGKDVKTSVDTELALQTGEKIYPVHRLDKETCGILVTAKNPKAATKWTNLIGSKKVKKTYHALCFGKFEKLSGKFDLSVIEKGLEKKALTYYNVLSCSEEITFSENPSEKICFSLVELTLETGRMHQIRKHLAQNKTPILADDKYGDFKLNKLIKKQFGIKRLMLLAKILMINSTEDKKIIGKDGKIEVEYPNYFLQAMEKLSLSH